MWRRSWIVGGVWLMALSAHADDIGPPPTACPPGARGESSHLGEWCEPHPCSDDAQCGPGKVCREAGLCVRTETGNMGSYHGNLPYTRQLVEGSGSCDACPAPASCTRAKYCYPPGAAPSTPPTPTTTQPPAQQPMDRAVSRGVDEDEGCRVGTGAPLGGIAAGILVLVAALASRRRRPQR